MNTKALSKVQRHTLNAILFLWVAGLHAAVVFAFEGTQPSPQQSDESFIEINIGLHAESMINMSSNEHDIQPVNKPAPQPQPEPQPEPEPEPERSPVLKTATESPVLRVPQRTAPNKSKPEPKPELTTRASSAKQIQAVAGSIDSTRTPSPAPRKVSRLAYMGAPPRPAYPSRALKGRQQGLVVVRVVIDRSGNVMSATVWQTSGSDALDQSALQALKTTRFKPYQDNGMAQEATADIPFNFVLKR